MLISIYYKFISWRIFWTISHFLKSKAPSYLNFRPANPPEIFPSNIQMYSKNFPITFKHKTSSENTENWWQKIIFALIYEKKEHRKKKQENKFIFEFQKIYLPQYFVHNAKTY